MLALAATFALHAQGVKDPDNNKATKGQALYFYGEPDYRQWQLWGQQDYYNWNDESCWFTDSDHEEPAGVIPTAADDVIILPYYDDDFVSGYFYLNEERNDVEIYYGEDLSYTLLAPMTAFFVKVTEDFVDDDWDDKDIRLEPWHKEQHDGEDYDILRSTSKGSTMSIELTSNGTRHDRVILNGKGKECTKFSMSSRTPKIFVPQGNKKYAMASTVGANVMPLCFTTQRSGIYTLNFDKKHMDCSYLHLIDNATGADIDLLSTPSYTFDSKDCYYEARFKVVFSEEATNDIMDSFANLSNGELVITGNGTLQVMDMLGRQLFTREVSSSLLLPASSLAPGVYVVRLINGNDVKAQKIVVG